MVAQFGPQDCGRLLLIRFHRCNAVKATPRHVAADSPSQLPRRTLSRCHEGPSTATFGNGHDTPSSYVIRFSLYWSIESVWPCLPATGFDACIGGMDSPKSATLPNTPVGAPLVGALVGAPREKAWVDNTMGPQTPGQSIVNDTQGMECLLNQGASLLDRPSIGDFVGCQRRLDSRRRVFGYPTPPDVGIPAEPPKRRIT